MIHILPTITSIATVIMLTADKEKEAMAKSPKVPVKIQRLMAACSGGQAVVLTLTHSEAGDERHFNYSRSGKSVGEWTVNRALEMGVLVASGEGLFPDLDSQTFRLANV